MPHMSRLIEGCGYNPYNPITKTMGFRAKGMGVIVQARKIIIDHVENEATAQTLMDWLINIINDANEK